MTTTTIPFASAEMGYDREQVDKYLQKLAGEYSGLQRLHTELTSKYNALVKQSNDNMGAIAKAMVDAETHAIRIVSEANAEASKIVNGAQDELKMIRNERARLITEISGIIDGLKLLPRASEPQLT